MASNVTMNASIHARPSTEASYTIGSSGTWLTVEDGSSQVSVFAGDGLDEQIEFVRKLASTVYAWHAQLSAQRNELVGRVAREYGE